MIGPFLLSSIRDCYYAFMKHQSIEASVRHLKKDARFASLIKKHGTPDLKRGNNPFQALVRSIIYQQLSGKAAGTIYKRFLAIFPTKRFPTPEEVKKVNVAKLRTAGISNQKASYLHDLADKFSNGTIKRRTLHTMTSAELVEHLVQVKGIGEWTVHMFLIFTLNRPDVLPTGDLGIKKGFQIVYNLKKLPEKKQMEQLAAPWREHASVASWYLWRAADDAKGVPVTRGKN